jgi:ABC-2 type transport system ATP-binding protein
MSELNRQGTTIILTTHYLEEAESLCRNIAIINQGRIVEHSRMDQLLRQLHTETFVLNLRDRITELPRLQGFELKRLDEQRVEVAVSSGQSINQLFEQLTSRGLGVTSLRNKQNRLEQLFMNMLESARNGARQ